MHVYVKFTLCIFPSRTFPSQTDVWDYSNYCWVANGFNSTRNHHVPSAAPFCTVPSFGIHSGSNQGSHRLRLEYFGVFDFRGARSRLEVGTGTKIQPFAESSLYAHSWKSGVSSAVQLKKPGVEPMFNVHAQHSVPCCWGRAGQECTPEYVYRESVTQSRRTVNGPGGSDAGSEQHIPTKITRYTQCNC